MSTSITTLLRAPSECEHSACPPSWFAVTIVRIGPNTVRLGIDAPREMNIVREELCQTDQAPQLAQPVKVASDG